MDAQRILQAGSSAPAVPTLAGHATIDSVRSDPVRKTLRRPRVVAFLFAAFACLLAIPGGATPAPVLLIVGDSVSAGYGLSGGQGWVDLLSRRLAGEKSPYHVVNASISGDTTASGRARLPTLLTTHKPAVVVLELGGNDALRGGDLAATRANLDAMIVAARASGAKVLLIGMKLPPNYGAGYVKRLDALYAEAAAANKVPLVPYLFEGFGENLDLFQPDRIHPTAAAQAKILDNVWPALSEIMKQAKP